MYVFEKPFESEKIKYGRNQLQRLWNVTYWKMKDKGPTHDSDRKSTRQPGLYNEHQRWKAFTRTSTTVLESLHNEKQSFQRQTT